MMGRPTMAVSSASWMTSGCLHSGRPRRSCENHSEQRSRAVRPHTRFSRCRLCPWARRMGRAAAGPAGGAHGDQDQAPGQEDLLVGDCLCLCSVPGHPSPLPSGNCKWRGTAPCWPPLAEGRAWQPPRVPNEQTDTQRGAPRRRFGDSGVLAPQVPALESGDPGPSPLPMAAGWAGEEAARACLPIGKTGRAFGRYMSCHVE